MVGRFRNSKRTSHLPPILVTLEDTHSKNLKKMAAVTRKCYYGNFTMILLFKFYSRGHSS